MEGDLADERLPGADRPQALPGRDVPEDHLIAIGGGEEFAVGGILEVAQEGHGQIERRADWLAGERIVDDHRPVEVSDGQTKAVGGEGKGGGKHLM
jgi:hypothetical protein